MKAKMKKLFLNLNILSLFTVASFSVFSCNKTYTKNKNDSTYDIGELKDFVLNYFESDDFQIILADEVKKLPITLDLVLFRKKIASIIFEKITSIDKPTSDELKSLKDINFVFFTVSGEPSNVRPYKKITVEKHDWESTEKLFKFCISSDPRLAQLGLNNFKKYYDHIKNNKVEIITDRN